MFSYDLENVRLVGTKIEKQPRPNEVITKKSTARYAGTQYASVPGTFFSGVRYADCVPASLKKVPVRGYASTLRTAYRDH